MAREINNSKFENEYFEAIEDEFRNSSKSYFADVITTLLSCLPKKNLLCVDVGCGTGAHFSELTKVDGIRLIGVDTPNDYTKLAISRGYITINQLDDLNTDSLPFENCSVDCILCKDVLEHLHNPTFLIEECGRVLRKGGTFLFHVPNHFSLYGRLKFLVFNRIDTFNYFGSDDRFNYPHLRFYKYEDFQDNLTSNGLVIQHNLSYLFPAIPMSGRFRFVKYLGSFLANYFPNDFAAGITIIGTKK